MLWGIGRGWAGVPLPPGATASDSGGPWRPQTLKAHGWLLGLQGEAGRACSRAPLPSPRGSAA